MDIAADSDGGLEFEEGGLSDEELAHALAESLNHIQS